MDNAHKAVLEIRNLLIVKRHQHDGRESHVTTDEIIREFQQQNETLVRRALPVLVPMSLRTLFNEGKRRRPKNIEPLQITFFRRFGVFDSISVPTKDGQRLRTQNIFNSTLDEIAAHRDRLPDPRDGASKDTLTALIAKLRPHQRNNKSTAGECWAAMQAAEDRVALAKEKARDRN
jgi:hypothetical protein